MLAVEKCLRWTGNAFVSGETAHLVDRDDTRGDRGHGHCRRRAGAPGCPTGAVVAIGQIEVPADDDGNGNRGEDGQRDQDPAAAATSSGRPFACLQDITGRCPTRVREHGTVVPAEIPGRFVAPPADRANDVARPDRRDVTRDRNRNGCRRLLRRRYAGLAGRCGRVRGRVGRWDLSQHRPGRSGVGRGPGGRAGHPLTGSRRRGSR